MEQMLSVIPYKPEYTVKTWVDALDKTGTWRLARIKKRMEEQILVAFDGWSDKHNQFFELNSAELAPLRMHSKGYTGQQGITLREYELQASGIKLIEHKMSLLKHTRFKAFSAPELTSFLRADLFVFIDDVLIRPYVDPEEELKFFRNFFLSFLDLYRIWLNLAPDYFGQFQLVQNKTDSKEMLYLENKLVACFEAGYELNLSFASLFGCDSRSQNFFTNFSEFVDIQELADDFLQKGGLIAFNKALKSISIESGEYLPFEMLYPSIIAVAELLNSPHKKISDINFSEHLADFSSIIINRLSLIISGEAKELLADKFLFEKFEVNLKKIFLLRYTEGESQQIIEFARSKFKKKPNKFVSFGTETYTTYTFHDRVEEERANLKLKQDQLRTLKTTLHSLQSEQLKAKDMSDGISQLTAQEEFEKLSHPSLYKLQHIKKFIPHSICDKQESAVLKAIQYLLKRGCKLEEIKRILYWRREIIALAQDSGWEMAAIVSKETFKKLAISPTDIIKAGLTLSKRIKSFPSEDSSALELQKISSLHRIDSSGPESELPQPPQKAS